MEIKFNNFNYNNKFTNINETLIDNHIIGITGDNYDFKDMFTLMKDRISDYDLKYYIQ